MSLYPDITDKNALPEFASFDISGRLMKGWGMIAQEGIREGPIDQWLDRTRAFVETLPSKIT